MGVDWKLQQELALKALNTADPAAKVYTYDSGGEADFSDLNEAIAACVAHQGDLILVAPGSHQVDEIVTFDVAGIRVWAANMGMPPEAAGERFMILPSSDYTDGPAAEITAPVHLRGLGFTTRNVSSGDKESAGLYIEGTGGWSGGFIWIENCRFSCWYGAQEYGIYQTGGVMVRIENCTFDGLFGGFGTAGIGLDDNGAGTTPDFVRILGNYFEGLGSSIPAVKLETGGVCNDLLMLENVNNNGFGTRGVLLDNNSLAAKGLVGGNWTGLANKAAAFVNLTNTALSFQDNHYDET